MRVSTPLHWSLTLGFLATVAGCQTAPTNQDPAPAEPAEPATPEVTPHAEVGDEASSVSSYADGTYEATGGYQSPNGAETIQVSVTLSAGVIDSVQVVPQADHSTSSRYQGMFADGIADEVVGVPIEDADVSRVAGSSLTSGGFAEALEAIREDAKVG